MVRISYQSDGHELARDAEGPVRFLLTNRRGGYLSLACGDNDSRYEGLYYLRAMNRLVKTVDMFSLSRKPEGLRHRFSSVERVYKDDALERFTYLRMSNTLVYELTGYRGELSVSLDIRETYDFDDAGRTFHIYREGDAVVVAYRKKSGRTYTSYAAIRGLPSYRTQDRYVKRDYPFDEARRSLPSRWWVYEGLRVRVDGPLRITITSGDDLSEVLRESEKMFAALDRKLGMHDTQVQQELSRARGLQVPDEQLRCAYLHSCLAMHELFCTIDDRHGIYAGLWWFFQWWSRDEAISSAALMKQEQYLFAKEILLRHIRTVFEDGRAPNIYPGEGVSSADGIGWSFRRLSDLMQILKKKKLMHMYLGEQDLYFILAQLETSLERMTKHYGHYGFVASGHNETWMDTCGGARSGACIEIQALVLEQYALAKQLCGELGDKTKAKKYAELHDAFREHIRKFFFSGHELADCIRDTKTDFTARPNVFLAYYISPQLLSHDEWTRVFDHALERLVVSWGHDKAGLATIDREHPQFTEKYSGQNNKSYHFGDVWYYINNLAALCLHRLDAARYKELIQKLVHTSCEEILWNGIIGHHAELSSAKEFRSEASLAQAWSSATFVELMHELYGTK